MPRPVRIEYKDAIYHVMNRGRARQEIFHGGEYYQAFVETLAEAQQRFQCVIHAYCLMGNHHHLYRLVLLPTRCEKCRGKSPI